MQIAFDLIHTDALARCSNTPKARETRLNGFLLLTLEITELSHQ